MSGKTTFAKKDFDVIILGSGIAGSILGAILARHGRSVLLVDAGIHPRFAVGESTTLYTLKALRQLAVRYGIPEFEYLTSTEATFEHIGASFGTKRNFGFMTHVEGQEPDPREVNQFSPPAKAMQTSHLHRPDSDSFLFHLAISYGCVAKQQLRATDVELGEHGVAIRGSDGERYTARYLADGSGYRSPVADLLGLRDSPDALKHHSRSMFSHMIDVRPTDEVLRMDSADHPPIPWVEGTMHHIIDRGWFWIIPFNNHPRSRNPLVSVGLTIDDRAYPKPDGVGGEAEFWSHVERYPVLERIFADAKTVRPWVSTGRLQYSSTRTVGHRWCLLSHAAGFIDPLYSRGLTNTTEGINALAWRLLAALEDDDFSTERFEYVDQLQKGLIRYNDELVNSSFISFGHYDLWNAVYRVWCAAEVPINFRFDRFLDEFRRTGDDAVFKEMESVPYLGLLAPELHGYKQLFDEMVSVCEAVDRGDRGRDDAARQLLGTIRTSSSILRGLGLEDPDKRFIYPAPEDLRTMADWLRNSSPEEMRYLAPRLDGHPGFDGHREQQRNPVPAAGA